MRAVRAYRALLRLFPPGFRRDEADEAARVFARMLSEAADRRTRRRIAVRCFAALPSAAAAEWWQAARASRRAHGTPRNGMGIMGGMGKQGRLSLRALLSVPSFTASAVLLVGIGVGAVTAVFTLVDHVLLRPLPYPEPERLVIIENGNHSGPLFEAMQTMVSVDGWAAAMDQTTTLVGEGDPIRLEAARVSRGFFDVFGARAARGRLLDASDFAAPSATVVVDGDTWQRLWGGDPDLVGRTIRLDGEPVTVIGVTDPSFVPPEALVGRQVDFWRPLDADDELLNVHTAWVLSVVGRLPPGGSITAARQEMATLMGRMATVHENYRTQEGAAMDLPVTPLGEFTVRSVRTGLGLLLGAVIMLLFVACANVAQLFLARGLGRHREMAVRRALGAGTPALVGQLLVESLLVGLAGGLLGLLLAWLGVEGFLRLTPEALPRQGAIQLDLRVLAFAAATAVVTALVFGLLPAVRSVRADVADALRGAGRGATVGRGVGMLRSGLVVGEVALSLVLVAGAGLLLRSFMLVHAQDPGIRTANVWTVPLSLTSADSPETWRSTMTEIGDAVAGVPGVVEVTYGLTMPLTGGGGRCCWRSEVHADGDVTGAPMIHPVTSEYFTTLGIPLRAGRVWTEGEAGSDPWPVVASERLAVDLWGSPEAAVNRGLTQGERTFTVVGVVGDTRHYGMASEPDPGLYVPVEHLPFPIDRAHLAVQTRPGTAEGLGTDLRRAIWSAAPDVPLPIVRSMEAWLEQDTSSRRFDSVLFTTFGVIALLLAAGGLYGTLLYLAGQRRREMGIRLALGASRGRIERDVVTGGLVLATVGVAIGLVGAWASGRWLESRLWGVEPGDPTTLGLAAGLLLATAAVASWLPARRAGRTDPVQTLRTE